MSAFVLIVSHGDRSGITSAWGPYETEEAAQKTFAELKEIGLFGIADILPLRAQVGLQETNAQRIDRQIRDAEKLHALGMPSERAVETVLGAEEGR